MAVMVTLTLNPERREGEAEPIYVFGFGFRNVISIGFPQSSLKSLHVGFMLTINAIFLIRVQPLICFSRAIAFPIPRPAPVTIAF